MIEVTLVVPMFNRPRTLEKILAALETQTLAADRFEAIFVDDSGPESYHIQKAILESAPRRFAWTYLTTGLPREIFGVTVARNKAIRAAKGSVLVFMDDDCVPNPHMLEQHLLAHLADPQLIAIANRAEDDQILKAVPPIPVLRDKCKTEAAKSARGELGAGSFITSNASAKRQLVVEAGMFDESFAQPGEYGYEDRDLGDRMLAKGGNIRFLQDAAVWISPKESDPWAGRMEEATAMGHARYKEKNPRTLLRRFVRWLKGPSPPR